MKLIFYISNIAVTLLGFFNIFFDHGDELYFGLLILDVSIASIIFARNSPRLRVKYANSVIALNIIIGIVFLGIFYVLNSSSKNILLVIIILSILVVVYVGINIRHIRSLKKSSRIDESETIYSKTGKAEYLEGDSGFNNETDVQENSSQTLTPATDLFFDEQNVSIEAQKEHLPVAKKVDWVSIQKARKHTGDFSEAIVVEYEKAILLKNNRAKLSNNVASISNKNRGYDVLSKFDNGKDKHIEVKAFRGGAANSFIVTRNELSFLQRNPKSSFVYIVTDCDTEPKILKISAIQFFKLKLRPSVFKITL